MADRTPGYLDGRRSRVGNVSTWSDVPNVLIPGTLEAYGIFEDFVSLEQLNIGGDSNGWDFWIQNAAVLSQGDNAGGAALITCGGTDEDSGQIILGALAGGGIFFPAADKHLWFEARVYAGVVSAAEFNYFIGLINPVNAAILADAGGAFPNDDMLGFAAVDGDANWSFVGDNASAEDLNPLGAGAVVTAAWHTLGFYVNGVTDVTVYYDRVAIAAGAIATANIPTTGLMPAIAVKAGAVAAETITVDYVMCVQLRV
ncbi:hypothetical protein LCGC14_1889950 [marine sediment metagenome]|uniref:Uncharacterized protein n=1 Tax=marine sediment metagenome TaxID=412755 RepID=A0A0F9GMZ0_9ZZZZ